MRVAVVTGGRSDRGILNPLIRRLRADVAYDLTVIATGASASGDLVVDHLLTHDSDAAIAKSTGLGVYGMADAYHASSPDLVVLLGDRFEILAAAVAAHLMRIPIAHLHGGEVTEGSLDDRMRNAITMLASIHLTSCEEHAERVRAMGRSNVHNVGALGLDNCRNVVAAEVPHPFVMVSVPEGQGAKQIADALILAGVEHYIWIGPNPDAGRESLKAYATVESLSPDEYLSMLKAADVIVGNSSSALYEAHPLGTRAVNVGDRQKGRVRPESVIDVPLDTGAIHMAIRRALIEPFPKSKGPFGDGHATDAIMRVLDPIAKECPSDAMSAENRLRIYERVLDALVTNLGRA